MSTPVTAVTLNDHSIVCRTCLKVLNTTGFTYIDDESGYVNNVGNIREMLQFCIPELDLYVSTQPVVCYQCLPVLVQVYNFKIKCLNGENTIKAYITRNNLQEYNHVNLNCVLMDDLRMKSHKIQIESRIKHLMLKELPESGEGIPDQPQLSQSVDIMTKETQANNDTVEQCYNIILTEPGFKILKSRDNMQEAVENDFKFEIDETDEGDLDYTDQNEDIEADDTTEEDDINTSGSMDEEGSNETQMTTVAVRRDLFENNNQNIQSSVDESSKNDQPTLILNNGILNQNGRIVIKIDRKKLQAMQTLVVAPTETDCTTTKETPNQSDSGVTPPPLAPLPVVTMPSNCSEESSTSQIISTESVEGDNEKETSYNCNKCSFVTNDVIKMYDHNRTFHSFDYTCQHCPFSTSKVELLGKHMTMVHPQNMVSQRSQPFKVTENYACSMCPFSVKSIDLLRSHHLSAHGNSEGPIVLNSAFSEDMSKNEPRILKRLEYTCDVCPYTTKDKSNLRKHLFTHGTKPLKCDHCTYKCVSPYQLRRHQKQKHPKHMDPRPRNQPYKLPDFKKEKSDALDNFKITLETIKREIEKEISSS